MRSHFQTILIFCSILLIVSQVESFASILSKSQYDSRKLNSSTENVVKTINSLNISGSNKCRMKNEINILKDIIVPIALVLLGFFLGRVEFILKNSRHKKHVIYRESSELLKQFQSIKANFDFLINNQIINKNEIQILPDLVSNFEKIYLCLNSSKNISKEVAFNKNFDFVKESFSKENSKLIETAIQDFLLFYNYGWLNFHKLDFDKISLEKIINELRRIKADNNVYKK